MLTPTGKEQPFNEGIRNNNSQTDNTPDLIVTQSLNGVQGKIDPANLPISEDMQTELDNKVSYGSDLKIPNSKIKEFGSNTGQLVEPNILIGTTYTNGFYVRNTDGVLVPNAAFTTTGFINIEGGKKYKYLQLLDESTIIYCSFFNDSNGFISGIAQNIASTNRMVTTPSNAKKIRVSYKGVGTSAPQNFFFFRTLKMTSYGDSTVQQNQWQPLLSSYLGLTSFLKGYAGYRLSGTTTSLNQDTYLLTIAADSDLILVLAGINDWAGNVPLGVFNSQDVNEFYGALNITFQKLKTNYPNAVVVALTTTYGEYPGRVGFTDPLGIVNGLGLGTKDYAEAVISAAKNNNVRYINTHNLWDFDNKSNYLGYDVAWIHPNSTGGQEIASKVSLDLVQDVLKLKNINLDANTLHKTGDETKSGSLTISTASAGGLVVDKSDTENSTLAFTSSGTNANKYYLGFETNSGFFGILNSLVGVTTSPFRVTVGSGDIRTNGKLRFVNPLAASTGAHGILVRRDTHGGSDSGDVQVIPSNSFAPNASPALTGIPTAPTATSGTNTTQLATTAFVQEALISPDIQDIVDATTKTGLVDTGNSQISVFEGSEDNRTFSVVVSPGVSGSTFTMQNNTASLINEVSGGGLVGGFIVNYGNPKMTVTKPGVGSTDFVFNEPVAGTTISLPAKPAGNYTVAMTSDLNGSIDTKVANYTTVSADGTILVNATSGNITITLLNPVGNSGKRFTVKKIDSSINTVTVSSSAGIDGTTTKVYSTQGAGGVFQSDGTQYYIIGNF